MAPSRTAGVGTVPPVGLSWSAATMAPAGTSTGVREVSAPVASYTTTAGSGADTSTATRSAVTPTILAAGDPVSMSARGSCLNTSWSLGLSGAESGVAQLMTTRAFGLVVQCSTVANCWSASAMSVNVQPRWAALGFGGAGRSPYWMVRTRSSRHSSSSDGPSHAAYGPPKASEPPGWFGL